MRTLSIGLALALAGPALAQDDVPEGRALAALSFPDGDGDGLVTLEEGAANAALIFVSMDSNADDALDEHEFLSWGFGMSNLADEAGTRQSHDTALRIVFDLWDRDNDQKVTEAEQVEGASQSYAYADADGDGALTEAEFLDNFLLNIGMRAALTAEP